MANRLQDASSPYLLQHADNPVDWFEWGEEAFEKARREDKPIFLSVGYSSCHWCHVMAHESFEDEELARMLNERFVPVKVDREERPDVDSVYMGAVQAMTGHGGWPMSVFLTPEGEPFFAGTYWPKEERYGMPGFRRVLEAVSSAWTDQRDEVFDSAGKVAEHLRNTGALEPGDGHVDLSVTEEAAALAVRAWDTSHGGFGRAPKFPQAMTIDFLLAHSLRTSNEGASRAAAHSLGQMARGGIYDHVGGGFHRYAVDEVWLVPHFEKMLYDNALLLRAYTHGWQVTGEERFARVARETADYLLREMRDPQGGFYSATDADSEGVEGKFFVWSDEEFRDVVAAAGEEPDEWARFYGVTPEGNWEGGVNILHEPVSRDETDTGHARRLATVRQALASRRETRVHPGLDDKVLTSWNALVLGALAEAGAAFAEERYITAARHCAAFLRDELTHDDRLLHTWKSEHGASVPAFLEDVAYLAQALLELYEADHDPAWFTWARELAGTAERSFADGDTGTYFSTAHDAEQLVTRPKELWDSSTPAGSSVMADVHLRLAALTGDGTHAERAQRVLATFSARASQAPTGFGELLRAMERMAAGPQEVAVAGEPSESDTRALVNVYRQRWRPGSVLAVGDASGHEAPGSEEPASQAASLQGHPVPLLAERPRVNGRPAAYVCRNFACERPVTSTEELAELLDVAS